MSDPVKRPSAADTEEDLLRLQAEFMKNKAGVKKDVISLGECESGGGGNSAGEGGGSRKRKKAAEPCADDRDVYQSMDDSDKSDLVTVLTNICELDISDKPITTPRNTPRGFPCVKDFQITEREGDSRVSGTRQKKSLFAAQYDKQHQYIPRMNKHVRGKVEVKKSKTAASSFLENVLPPERMAIEDQTNKILNQMSEQEKREQAEKIFKNMDPKLVEFLKRRKREAEEKRLAEERSSNSGVGMSDVQMSSEEPMDVAEQDGSCCRKDNFLHPGTRRVEIEGEAVDIPVYVAPGHHPNMGELEPEKLQWMSSAAGKSNTATDRKDTEVRFDFDGKIVPRDTHIHPDRALHHHGEEANQAGYTLDELFILSRSTVLRQRQIALETLVHITQRARHSMYSGYVKQTMLQLLLDSGIVQLFRHALDSSEYELALQGLAALLLAPTEVFIQDELYPHLSLYTLQPSDSVTKDMDHDTVLATDVVRLLVDSQLPQRMWYLLSKHKLTDTMVDNILNIVQHVAQHSLHVAMAIVNHGSMLDKIVELFLPIDLNHTMFCEKGSDCLVSHPSHIAVKILRILSSHSKYIAEQFISQYKLDSLIKVYLSLNHKDFRGDEMLRCQVEICKLWGVMLRWELCVNVYSAVYPILVRELSTGGQRSVKLTSSLLHSLTVGVSVFPWEEVGAVYHPVIANVMSWAHRPQSDSELPPTDDINLMTTVFSFLTTFIKLHHSKHFDVNLVEQVTDLVNRLVGPLVTGTMCDNAISFMVHSHHFQQKKSLQIRSLPTLEIHHYYKQTDTQMEGAGINELAGKLDLASISENGEKVLLFFACARFITEICCFLSTAFSINKELSDHVTSFLAKCSHLSRLERRYKNGIPLSRIPDILYHTVTLLHYQYLMLAGRMMKRGGAALDEELRSSLFMTGIRVVAELRPGYEYHQFNLITGLLFDGHVNPTCWNCGAHFLKCYEAIVSRDSIAKSQEFWTETRKSPSQFVGKLVSGTNVKVSWIFLTDDIVTSLPEQTLFEYLMFLHHLLIDCKLQSVPVCVQLIHVMKIFMLPSQPFLQSRLSQYLDKFLTYFSSLSFIDFKQSTLSGYPSFYDFYNLFCGSYEAEGFCDPVFAGFVLLPTRCDYALTYRRLLWVERIETLRMLRTASLPVHKTLPAPESDADLMCIYMSALKNGITGIPKLIAMHHVVRFFTDDRITKDDKLLTVMLKHVALCSDQTKEELLKFDKVNEHNEIVFHEKMVDGRKQKFGIN